MKHKTQKTMDREKMIQELIQKRINSNNQIYRDMEKEEERRTVRAAIAELSEREREIVVLSEGIKKNFLLNLFR